MERQNVSDIWMFASGDFSTQGLCISFDEQIERDYRSVHAALTRLLGQAQASNHLAKSIFALAIGGNDIIDRILLDHTGLLSSTSSSQQFIDSLALSLKRQLQVCGAPELVFSFATHACSDFLSDQLIYKYITCKNSLLNV
jgi:hypothetical protein